MGPWMIIDSNVFTLRLSYLETKLTEDNNIDSQIQCKNQMCIKLKYQARLPYAPCTYLICLHYLYSIKMAEEILNRQLFVPHL